VPEAAHDQLEEGADIGVRFADEYPGHTCRIDDRRRESTSRMV
jgi:hypothetical protein